MESKIRNCIPTRAIDNHTFHTVNHSEIHIVDWKNFDKGKGRGVEICDRKSKEIESVCLFNESNVSVFIDAFGENALPQTKGKNSSQCECLVTPTPYSSGNWILVIETKYAEDYDAAFREKEDGTREYPEKMVSQIISTINYFRDKGVIEVNKMVFAIISFPKLIEDFNSVLFSFIKEEWSTENLILNHKIRIKGCNSAKIISPKRIKHV